MAKIKVEDNMVWVLLAAVRLYSANFLKFCGYMLFPVLGQVLGLGLIFGLAAVYMAYLPDLALKYDVLKDFSTIILSVIIIVVPGLLVFMKAFWDYLVAYGALNSITEGFLTTGRIYDYPAHNEIVTRQAIKYIGLWFLYSMFWLVALCPLFWVVGAFFFIYFILIFQVFTFEQDASPARCFSRSFELIRGSGIRTLLILIVLGVITFLFVQGVSVIFDFIKLTGFLSEAFEQSLVNYVPIDSINDMMLRINPSFDLITPSKVATGFVYQIVSFIVAGFTLPLRSICWTLWYKALVVRNKPTVRMGKRRQLDPEIIERATRKYND